MNDISKFEKYLEEYKHISEKLENQDLSLSESIKLYSRSQEVYSLLQSIIDEAKLQVNYINEDK